MELFQAIPVDRGDETIRAALAATINRARENQLTTDGWSLAELKLDNRDVEWLCGWARALDDVTAKRWLLPEPADTASVMLPVRRAAIGVLLLLLTAEQARRIAGRDDDWLVAPSSSFNESIRNLLFSGNQPTELYINSLMQASERLHLRQNGGWTTPHSEHENIALQIALTEADLVERWPRWLRGETVPEHIARLLETESGSHSFRQLWQTCCDFLESVLSETDLRAALTASPWILPQWIDLMVRALEFHRQEIARVMRAEALTMPLPVEVAAIETGSQFELGGIFDSLTPYGGVKTIIRATRAILARADKLGLRDRAWSLAELRANDCDYLWLRVWVKRLDVLTVWFGTETEHRFNAKCKDHKESVGYRAALGCLLLLWLSETVRRNVDEGDLWTMIHPDDFDQAVAAELFRKNQPSGFLREAMAAAVRELNLRHALDDSVQCWRDTVFLQFGFSQSGFNRHLPTWLSGLSGQMDMRALRELLGEEKGSTSFRTLWETLGAFRQDRISEGQVRRLIAGSEWILPEWVDELVVAARRQPEFEQKADAVTPELPPTLLNSITRAARLTANGWQALTGEEVLTIEEAKSSLFRIKPPVKRDERGEWIRWAVMEGEELATRWEETDQRFNALRGWGAPLTLRSGPFDNPKDEFCIAASIIDRGLIEDAVCESPADGAARWLRLKVAGHVEPSDRHFIVWWNENGEVGKLWPDSCEEADDGWWWVCKVPEGINRFIAVAIARDGLRLGAWWEENWAELLLPVMRQEPLLAAALLRWFRLPLLSEKVAAAIRDGGQRQAPAFLAAWLKDYGLPEWLRAEVMDDRALSALRSVFRQWWPNPEMACQVLMTLANAVQPNEVNANLREVAKMLCQVDPLLLAAILKVGKEQILLGSSFEVRLGLAVCETKAECDARKQALMTDCAEQWGVDRSSIQAGLLDGAARWLGGYELHRHEASNLALAAQIEQGRLLLALHLLERI